jgi:hypothetical protein
MKIILSIFLFFQLTTTSFAQMKYGVSTGMPLISTGENYGLLESLKILQLRGVYPLDIKFLHIEGILDLQHSSLISLSSDNSVYSADQFATRLLLLPGLKWEINSFTFFGGVALDWHIFSRNRDSTSESPLTSKPFSSFFSNSGKVKPDIGWLLGSSIRVSQSAELDIKIYNDGMGWQESTYLFLGVNFLN